MSDNSTIISAQITSSIADFLRSTRLLVDTVAATLSSTLDAVDFAEDHGIANTRSPNPRGNSINWTISAHIHQRLGHLIVNPSRPIDTSAVLRSYCTEIQSGEPRDSINNSKNSIDTFVEEIVNSAKIQRDLRQRSSGVPTTELRGSDSCYLLHGARGCGKTSLQNYILSAYQGVFDLPENKIIWVRINLVEDLYGSSNPTFEYGNLVDWICGQAAKIILRYYDQNSKLCPDSRPNYFDVPPSDALRAHVYGLSGHLPLDDRREYVFSITQKLQRLFDSMFSTQKDETISPQLIEPAWGKFLYDYAQEKGYSFVIVLDGMDVMESTQSARSKFTHLRNATKVLVKKDDLFGSTLLVIMRSKTFEIEGDPYASVGFVTKRVGAARLADILAARFRFIDSEVVRLAESDYRHWIGDVNFEGWPVHLSDFEKYIDHLRSLEADQGDLMPSFGNNRRAQMQMVQLSYMSFIEKRQRQSYRLVETAMRSGWRFPPQHYRYGATPQGKVARFLGQNNRTDSRFLPSIFSFPVLPPELRADGGAFGEQLLMNLRIMQFVHVHDKAARKTPGTEPLKSQQLAHLLSVLFGYDSRAVVQAIGELEEFEVIRTQSRISVDVEDPTSLDIVAMPKLSYIVDKLVFDVAYLNMAVMRAPLNSTVLAGASPFVRAVSLNQDGDRFDTWIAGKILNAIAAARLIVELNGAEERRCLANQRLLRKVSDPPRLNNYERLTRAAIEEGVFASLRHTSDMVLKTVRDMIERNLTDIRQGAGFDMTLLAEEVGSFVRRWDKP